MCTNLDGIFLFLWQICRGKSIFMASPLFLPNVRNHMKYTAPRGATTYFTSPHFYMQSEKHGLNKNNICNQIIYVSHSIRICHYQNVNLSKLKKKVNKKILWKLKLLKKPPKSIFQKYLKMGLNITSTNIHTKLKVINIFFQLHLCCCIQESCKICFAAKAAHKPVLSLFWFLARAFPYRGFTTATASLL